MAEEVVEKLSSGYVRNVPTLGLAGEGVPTGALAAEAVTAAKIASKAVTAAKANEATVPTPAAAESLTALAGTAGVGRVMTFAYTAKHEASAKVKLIHNLGTEAVVVQAFKAATKKPGVNMELSATTAGAIAKWEPVSANETLVTLGTGEPAAKEEFFYTVIG